MFGFRFFAPIKTESLIGYNDSGMTWRIKRSTKHIDNKHSRAVAQRDTNDQTDTTTFFYTKKPN